MTFKYLQYCCCLVVLLLVGLRTNALQTDSGSKDDNWKLCTVCEIPARLALNSSPAPALVPRRYIYLFIEPRDFTEKNLTKAFEKLSAEYADPISLRIVAFSNKAFLKQLISAEERAIIIDFAESTTGRKAERDYYSELYPPRKGYFRSYYLRTAVNEESFQYSPDPMNERTIQIVLRSGMKK